MDSMNIQWYPGHMTKTRRQMEQDLKLVDAVCELLDARIPISSRNPDIAALCGPKPRLVILNRMDMADPAATRAWCEAFRRESLARRGNGLQEPEGTDRLRPRRSESAPGENCPQCGQGAKPPPEDHGGGDSQCGKVHVYQPDFREKGRKGGEPPRASPGASSG